MSLTTETTRSPEIELKARKIHITVIIGHPLHAEALADGVCASLPKSASSKIEILRPDLLNDMLVDSLDYFSAEYAKDASRPSLIIVAVSTLGVQDLEGFLKRFKGRSSVFTIDKTQKSFFEHHPDIKHADVESHCKEAERHAAEAERIADMLRDERSQSSRRVYGTRSRKWQIDHIAHVVEDCLGLLPRPIS